jgi:hypothetical protein
MLTKEFLGLCLPAVVLLALCWHPGVGFRFPRPGPREGWLAGLLVVVIALELWSVLSALQDAVPGSYASAFGRQGIDPGRALTLMQAMLLPARFSSAGTATLLYPGNLAFLALLLLGLVWPTRVASRSPGSGWFALGLLTYPLIGGVAYALWPRYAAYYGIPFFVASAGLLAAAGTRLEQHGQRAGRVVLAGLGAVAVFFTALVSVRTVRQKQATADLAVSISQAWAASPRLDTLLIVTPPVGRRRWPINARELRNYARFLDVPDSVLPVMLDASCDAVLFRLQQPLHRSAVLNDQNPCGRLPVQTRTWAYDVGYLDWASLTRIADTMWVDLLAPSWGIPR